MRLKVLSTIAALLLVAACETPVEETQDSSGSGATTQKSASDTTSQSTTGSSSTSTTTTASTQTMAGPKAGSQADLVASVGDRVFFDFDKFSIKPKARGTLERQAAWLKRNPNVTITVEGHCDERGTREYNLGLGQRRANAVKKYLMALGIAENRIATISYGKERPVALASTEAAWAQNRRGVSTVN